MATVVHLLVIISVCDASSVGHTPSTKLYDLSHAYSPSMPFREGTSPFEPAEVENDGDRFSALEFCMSEKLGTHINFPSYYGVSQNEDYSLHRLVNIPCVVLDVGGTIQGERGVAVTRAVVEQWEEQHGRLPAGSLLILRSGWSTFFSQADRFYGLFSDEDGIVMPGFNESAAAWLVAERGVSGVATECPSIEVGGAGIGAGQALADAGAYSLVQVTGVEQLPPTGAMVTVAPLKIEGGTGGPVRLLAMVPQEKFGSRGVEQGNTVGHQIGNNSNKVKRVEPTTASSEAVGQEAVGQEAGLSYQIAGLDHNNMSAHSYSSLYLVIICVGFGLWSISE